MFSRWLDRYARWVVRHPWTLLAAIALVTIGLGAAATRLRVEVDADRQLPQDHPYVQALNDVYRLFGDKNLVVIGLFPNDGRVFTPAFLRKLSEVTTKVSALPGAHAGLVQSLAAPQVKDIRGTADGLEVERVMDAAPADQAGAEAVRARAFANEVYVGTLVAADGSAAAVQASFELTPASPGYRQLHAAIVQAMESAQDGTFTYRLSGPVVFLSQLSAYASRMALFFPLALLVIGLVHYHAFRTLQGLFLPLLTALLAVLWAVGLMGVIGVPLDPLNTTTPILILAVAAGHAVQVLKRFYEEYDGVGDVRGAVVRSLVRVGPVMLAAGTVAALSFGSLATFHMATIRTFGIFTGLGIFSALAIEMTLVPALRSLLPAPRHRERAREAAAHPILDSGLGLAGRLATQHATGVIVGAGILVALCGALATRITVDHSIKRQFKVTDPVRIDDAKLNQSFAGTNTLIFLVEGDGEGSLEEPSIMRAIAALQRRLGTEPEVGRSVSYVDFVRRMHQSLNADHPDAGELPDSRKLTAQYLFLYSLSGGSEDFDAILDPTHRFAKVRFLVHEDSTLYGERLIATAQEFIAKTFPPGYRVRFTGTLASSDAITQVLISGKLRNIIQIACITVLVSALLLRSLMAGLLVAVPLALTIAVNFGVMGLLRVPLDHMTSTISAMAVGIGADYAMYFLFRVREERAAARDLGTAIQRALVTSGKAILFVSSAIAAGYATLCLSGFALHVELGALVALAMIVSSASALLVLPALLMRLRPRFLEAVAPEAGAPSLPTHDERPVPVHA